MKNKKGQIDVALVVVGIIALVLLFLSGSLLTWMLGLNIYSLSGIVLLGIVAATYYTGHKIPTTVAKIFIFGGIVLLLLPFLSDTFGTTLAMVI